MSDLYSVRSSGKLKLKGEKKKHKKDKKDKKRKAAEAESNVANKKFKEDRGQHGGWWSASTVSEITGPIAIEFGDQTYVKACDDGSFTIGAKHDEGEGPAPEEVLVAIKINETKVAFKSGYNKYVRVDRDGGVMGVSDAVGAMEQWEPVFQDGKLALLGANGKFLSLGDEDTVECSKQRATESEMIKVRSNNEREEDKEVFVPEEERGKIGQVELNYVKKFQKFQNHKIKLCDDDRNALVTAKKEGNLHETLLDRRSKMKADRYCK